MILCGRRNLPLRGHRDSGSVNLKVDYEPGEGKFKAFLRFRVESGDQRLAKWVDIAPRNALHTSWETQNEMINICGELVTETIAKRVRRAGMFSIIADETTDVATMRQLSVCVRYVDKPADENSAERDDDSS